MVGSAVGSAVGEQRRRAAPRATRPRWRTLWVIAPALFLVLLVAARVVYWRTSVAYAPLKVKGDARPAVGQSTHVRTSASGLLLTGRAGTAELIEFPIENDGLHALDINRVTAEDAAVVSVRWAANRMRNGAPIPTPARRLPAHIAPHTAIGLLLLVRKPACSRSTTRYLSGVVTLHWHAMISPHATKMDLLGGHPAFVTLCSAR